MAWTQLARASGVLAAGVGACVGVLVTVGLGFTVLTAAGAGFAVTVLVTVGLGSGARTTVGPTSRTR